MSLGVSKDCFPNSSKCHNCERKVTGAVKKETDRKINSKRCANCHLMTYCDENCQKEHWVKVHKKHCRFLSGKVPVKNSSHDTATCARCIQEKETTRTQILSENSPKTRCNIETVEMSMNETLSNFFGFHGEGKKCSCTLEYGLQLPFALGEVSGQYLETAGTGLDPLLAHAIKIVMAMLLKAKDSRRGTALYELLSCLIRRRACLWYNVLVYGKPEADAWDLKDLFDHVESLQTIYGVTNPWWKILSFSVEFITNTKIWYEGNSYDSNSLEDPRFQELKLLHIFSQSQLNNQAMVCRKKVWPHFMLWPQVVNGSMVVFFPPGTRCQSCSAQLLGEPAISPQESLSKFLPNLLPLFDDNGAIVAFCPPIQKPSCGMDYLNTNVYMKRSDENQRKEYEEEKKLFAIESRDCDFCFKGSLSSHRCSACLTVQYCSLACQKEDLDFHKTVCATWAKDESRKLLGKRKQKQHWKKTLAEK